MLFLIALIIKNNKKRIQYTFKKRLDLCLFFKILICIEIYEIKINNSNIKQVI